MNPFLNYWKIDYAPPRISGALIYIEIEKPHEEKEYQVKLEKSKEVDAAISYLKKIFWHYANNKERYNYTQTQFSDQVYVDLETLKNFVIQVKKIFKSIYNQFLQL